MITVNLVNRMKQHKKNTPLVPPRKKNEQSNKISTSIHDYQRISLFQKEDFLPLPQSSSFGLVSNSQ